MNTHMEFTKEYPRCVNCHDMYTAKSLHEGKCPTCRDFEMQNNSHLGSTVLWILLCLAIVLIAGCTGYRDKQEDMQLQQFAAGNWTPKTSYSEYQSFVAREHE